MNFKNLFFGLLLLSSAGTVKSQKVTPKKNPGISQPVITAPATKTYKNDSLRVSLNYPAGWKVIDESNNKKNSLKVTFTDDVNNISLSNIIFDDSGEDYAAALEGDFAAALLNYSSLVKSKILIGKNEFYDFRSLYESQGNDRTISMLLYSASAGNYSGCYNFIIDCAQDDYSKYAKVREAIAESLKELPPLTKSYSDKKLKISFKYPSNWRFDASPGRVSINFVKSAINISGIFSSSSSLKDIAESQVRSSYEDYTIEDQKEFILKGKKIYLVKATYQKKIIASSLTEEDKEKYIPYFAFIYIATYLDNGSTKPFKIVCSFPLSKATKYAPYFEQFIKNIEFIK